MNVPAGRLTGARNGNDVPNVPALTANLGIQYEWSADMVGLPGSFTGRLTYQHVGSRAADVTNSFKLDSYNIVNARLTWNNDKGVSVYAFANNLFDERYEAWGQNFGVPTVRVGQGRVIGFGTSFQF